MSNVVKEVGGRVIPLSIGNSLCWNHRICKLLYYYSVDSVCPFNKLIIFYMFY